MTDRYFIGGSDAASACGLDPYRSPVKLWLEKTGQIAPPDESEAMMWGKRLEPVLGQWVAEMGEYDVMTDANQYTHPEHEWMRGKIDGRVTPRNRHGEMGVLELKTASLRAASGWEDDQIPLPYQVQGQHYLAVTGLGYAVFGALIGGQRFVVRRMERDEEIINLIIQREAAFWKMIEDRTPPPPVSQDTELLKLLYPGAIERKIVTLDHLPDVRHRYRMAKDGLKAAETALAAVENEVKGAMGDAELATIGLLPAFRWTNVQQKRLDAKALQEDNPDLFDLYYRDTQHRRFQEIKR